MMDLFLPMFFYVVYIVLLGILNFLTRKDHARKREVSLGYFRTYTGAAPDRVLVVGRHFDNQFQIPLLFFITCLATQFYGASGPVAVALAWLFIASRLVHSFIHLGSNNVLYRATAYMVGVILVLTLWVHLFFHLIF